MRKLLQRRETDTLLLRQAQLELMHHAVLVVRDHWAIFIEGFRLKEVEFSVVLDERGDGLLVAEHAGPKQVLVADGATSDPILEQRPEFPWHRPPFPRCEVVRVNAARDIHDELLLSLELLVVLAHAHVGLDNHSKEEVLDEQEDDHEVEHREQPQLEALCPVVGELSERHLEELLQRGLEVGKVGALGAEGPGRDARKARHEQQDQDGRVPQVVPCLDEGALEESETRVHGGAFEEAQQREEQHEGAQSVQDHLPGKKVVDLADALEELRRLLGQREISRRPLDVPELSNDPQGVIG
mmetsp:Transcript_80878/g.121572  ORF Transcript_80878/g.121572 Transcript_80878/m.121572 type:complete len:298 (-) Transcript_80878:367-1260(-)